MLIADEDEQRPDEIAAIIRSLGHEVVSRLTEGFPCRTATERERPDVAVVSFGQEQRCPRSGRFRRASTK